MNFKELVSTLAREAGVSGGGAISSVASPTGETARLVGWVKLAYADIQRLWLDWRFLWTDYGINTEAGTADYPAPLEWHWWDRDKAQLDGTPMAGAFIDYELWDGYSGEQDEDKPNRIVLMPDGSLKLIPTPDDVYSLSVPYYRRPHTLALDTDIPILPEAFHDLIWMRALLKYAYYESAPEVLERVGTEYPELLAQLERHQLPNHYRHGLAQDADPITVRPV